MSHTLLLVGLLLPWLLGCSWLYPWRRALILGTAGLLGYGYFLGAALLYLALLGWYGLFGTVSFWPLASTLAGLAVIGFVGGTRLASLLPAPATTRAPTTQSQDWLAIGLLGLVAAHLALIALELYYRPVFPWDAWQTWMYKAKAWYFSGGPVALDAPEDWINSAGSRQYNVQANHYPGLVPAMSYWAAIALGQWSETRVNWPTFFCGLALCLALWEQVKATTGSARVGAAACLMLISIPLVGTHLSLAGYADIWLAGFSGLGMVALLRGLLQRHRGQCVLGLLLLATGLLAKNDAAVWLACGAALLLLVRYTRFSLLLAGLGALGLLVLAMAGVEYIAVPYLGPLGIHDKHLALGPLGSWSLRPHNVLPAYFEHLFLLGSWNLLWYLLLALVVLLVVSPQLRALRAPAGWFLLLMVASQALLFGLTAAGAWATDGTSLNRLLLHITPALLYVLVVGMSRLVEKQRAGTASNQRQLLLAAGCATLVAGVGASLWLTSHTSDSSGAAKTFNASNMQAVVGTARTDGGQMLVTEYDNGAVIIASDPTVINTDELQLAQLAVHSDNRAPRTFFWRQQKVPERVWTRQLGAGERWIDLRPQAEWSGRVSEVGVMLYEDSGRTTGLFELRVHPATALNLARLTADQWQQGERWSLKSTNSLRIGAADQLLPFTALLGGWLLVALLVLTLGRRGRHSHAAAATLIMVAWLVFDLRWLYNSYEQAKATREHYTSTAEPAAMDMGADGIATQLAEAAIASLGEQPKRVAIAAVRGDMRFQLLRTKYALLPHAGYVHEGELGALPSDNVEAVLLLHDMAATANISLPPYIHRGDGRLVLMRSFNFGALYLPQVTEVTF